MKLTELFESAEYKTLYCSRPLLNADEVIEWAKSQGFENCLDPEDMHVTIAHSKKKIDWAEITNSSENVRVPIVKKADDERSVEEFNGGAIVLRFDSDKLEERWKEFVEVLDASWDFPDFKPHVTITYNGLPKGMKLDEIEPYLGRLVFGPEHIEEVDTKWKAEIEETKLTEARERDQRTVVARNLIADVIRYARSLNVHIRLKFPAFHAPEIEITDLFAKNPGEGAGTKVLRHLNALADEYEFNIYVLPSSKRNAEFYARLGYTLCRAHPGGIMIRYCSPDDNSLDESFRLSDINDPEQLYQTFRTSYEKETGKSWTKEKLFDRAAQWKFYGTEKGFVAVREQDSGMKKLVAVAGDLPDILKGLHELVNEGGPIWGAVSGPLAVMAKKVGMVAPHLLPGGAFFIKKLLPTIPASVFGGIEPSVTDNGGIVFDYPDVGRVEKYLIGNKDYFLRAAKMPQVANVIHGNPQIQPILKAIGI